MKIVLYIMIIVCSFLVPVKKTDVAKLQPIEAVSIQDTGERIVLSTDTGAFGVGKNVGEAILDLKSTTAGVIYLDTAEYLLIKNFNQVQIEQISSHLKGNVKVCIWDGKGEIRDVVKYLSAHGNLPKLKSLAPDYKLPELIFDK